MYVGSDFQPSDTGESESYTFDFSNDFATSETISSATWSISVVSGTDASASSRLVGSPSNTSTKSSQRVTGLQDGVTYLLRAVVITSAGNTISLYSHVAASAPS